MGGVFRARTRDPGAEQENEAGLTTDEALPAAA
jgi:hypothetical protein